MIKRTLTAALLAAFCAPLAHAAGEAKNVIFFLGDGMGPTTTTAARIYKYGESGSLNFDKFERAARIITYSNDAQTTDSAPSMASYMTGVKANNEVIAMTANTIATPVTLDAVNGTKSVNACGTNNGSPVQTMLELAKARGKAVGAITTTELTHATPAATYAHICNRNAAYDIAAQLVPGGAGSNPAFATSGVDVLMGGGRNHFTPYNVTTNPKGRSDGRDLTAELATKGYTVAADKTQMAAATTTPFIGLYSANSHLAYELDRVQAVSAVAPATVMGIESVNQVEAAAQPSLSEMTVKSIQLLSRNTNGFFLMVEGGRIDHALHGTNAKRVLEDTIAFDDAVLAAINEVKKTDPTLANTLIVVTADHDHTMTFNGYVKRGNPILDISRSYVNGADNLDVNGVNSTTLVFGNGPNRPATRTALTSAQVTADNYLQEAGVRLASETHGGGDVKLLATGAGSQIFKGTMDNTKVFTLLKTAYGF